jgi:heme A synthase
MTDEERQTERRSMVEHVAIALLAITAVLTAWTGFEASKWSGEMSIAFSRASSQRIAAAREATTAEAARAVDLQVFGIWLEATSENNHELADFAHDRFTDHFAPAFEEWLATRPLRNPDAPRSPFAMDGYVPPGEVEAQEADSRADDYFAAALTNNRRGDNYTLLTVLFALVLFFGALSNRFGSERKSWTILAGAGVLLLVGVGLLIAFPKII